MKAGTGLARGPRALAELAQEAVGMALAGAGLQRADHVLLFLTRDFARHPQPALLAAARAAGTLAVGGCTANGLFTEKGWQLDQSAAAALVCAAVGTRHDAAATPILSFAGNGRLPGSWLEGARRAGLLDADGAAWAHGRLTEDGAAEHVLPGQTCRAIFAAGLRRLGDAFAAGGCEGYEIRRLGGQPALEALRRQLPPEAREHPPIHRIVLQRTPEAPAIAIVSANGDGSLMLAEALREGETVCCAMRQPLAAEHEIRAALEAARAKDGCPAFGLMFSCIGRGPLFYGNDDRDLAAFRDAFPGTPLLGAYGTGQIAPVNGGNRLFHNAALTLLYGKADV